MDNEQRIEELHQKAASAYLQGNFDAARVSWEQLLVLDAEDERAREGLELCRIVSEHEQGAAVAVPAADPAAEALDELFGGELQASPAPAEASVSAMPAAAPDAEPPALELGDLPDIEPAVEDLSDLDSPEPDPPQGAGPDEESSRELARRTEELMREAITAYDAGDSSTALRTLERLCILDEDNQDAARLRGMIEAELAEHPPEAPKPPPSEPPSAGGPVLFDAPADLAGAALVDSQDAAGSLSTGALPDAPAPSPEGAPADSGLMPSPETAPPEEAATGAKPTAMAGRRWAMLGAVTAAVLVVGLVAAWWLWPSATQAPDVDQAYAQLRREGPAPAGERTGDPEPDDAATQAVPEQPTQPLAATPPPVTELLSTGRAAFNDGDYASAMRMFHQVLATDPAHGEAGKLLAEAERRQRERQEFDRKLDLALEQFRLGDYRASLRLLYRLPGAENDPSFDGYKRNGWYNLALRDLRSGNCAEARSKISEAEALDSKDSGVRALSQMARLCRGSQYDPAYAARLRALSERTLDD